MESAQHVSKHARSQRNARESGSILFSFIGFIGELLITAAIVMGLFVVWQAFWTTLEANGEREEAVASFESTTKRIAGLGEEHFDAPPAFDQELDSGQVFGLLHVPKWDWMRMPLGEGVGHHETLKKGWAGHYPKTSMPGEIGNFSIAAHRYGYGNSFQRIEELAVGDELVVETDKYYLTYVLDNHHIVSAYDEDNFRVIAPVPGDVTFAQEPTERMMTMTTCHPMYDNYERYIVHLKFKSWTPKETGVPSALVEAPWLIESAPQN